MKVIDLIEELKQYDKYADVCVKPLALNTFSTTFITEVYRDFNGDVVICIG